MSIKSFVNDYEHYTAFLSFLDKKIDEVRNALECSKDYEVIRHLQGQIFALRKLKNMKEEVTS